MNKPSCDVLVLGGGVIGLVCALRLLQAGRSVTVIEGKHVGAGASHGNCGTITPSHLPLHQPGTVAKGLKWLLTPDAPFLVRPFADPGLPGWLLRFARLCNDRDYRHVAEVKSKLLLESRKRLEALVVAESLDCEFERSGTFYVYRTEAAFEKSLEEARLLADLGVPIRTLQGPEVQQLEPALKPEVIAGHHHPDDARLRPDRYVRALADAVRRHGGTIMEGTEITGFDTRAGRLEAVQTRQGPISGRDCVFALGAWSPKLGKLLGLNLPIQPGKGYSITYARPERAPTIPMVLKETYVCVTSWDSGYRLGSTMEFAGYDTSLNPVRLAALERGARDYLVDATGPRVEEQWSGFRPMVPDDLPIIGRAPTLENLWLATGHGMLGVSLSAITGDIVCAQVTGGELPLDASVCRPERF